MMITYGQSEVARWCGVKPPAIAMWIVRYDNWPAPDVEVRTGRWPVRGWLPSRRPEWEQFAAMRAS